jgi:2-haloacid dehalogenase
MVANDLGVAPDSLLMVAAHAWDIAGAMRVGLAGTFLARPGQILDDLTPRPAYVASDLVDLSRQILAQRFAP